MRMVVIVVFLWTSVFWDSLVSHSVCAQELPSPTEVGPPSSIDQEIRELEEEGVARFRMGAYDEAYELQKAAQKVMEQKFPEVFKALARFNKGEHDEALALLKRAAEKHPDLPPAQVMMADLYRQVNQRAPMRCALDKATVEAPDDPEAYAILGKFALREHRVTEAYLCYDKANSLLATFSKSPKRRRPLQARVTAGLGAVAEAREQWPKAQMHLEVWLKLDPENAVALQRLGRALFMQKKAQEAKDALEKAAKADPKVLNWAAQLALLYQRMEDSEKAKQWMTYALQLKPNDLRTWLVAAQWSLGTKQLKQAQEYAAKAMNIDSKSLEAKILRGVIAAFQRDFEAAERYFEDAHLQSPGNFQASNNLALALAEQSVDSKKRRALEYARANAERYPKVPEAASTYGWVLYKIGKVDEADRVFGGLLRSGNLAADTLYYIAQVAAEKGRPEQAKRLLNAAIKSNRPFSKEQEARALLERL